MDVTITLSPADVSTFAANFTQARSLSAHPETLFHEETTSWVEDAADNRTLNYGTCFWFQDALGAVFAKKVFEAAGETAFWLSNDQDPDASLCEYPPARRPDVVGRMDGRGDVHSWSWLRADGRRIHR